VRFGEYFLMGEVTIPAIAFMYRYGSDSRFPSAMATHLNEYFKPFVPVTKNDILTACGITAIEGMLAYSIGDPGDGILVSRPIYGRFELDFGNMASLQIIYTEMNGVDGFKREVVAQYENAFENATRRGIRIRALLISNPSNPLGLSSQLHLIRLPQHSLHAQDGAIRVKRFKHYSCSVTFTAFI
jgi:1-aminocyclopropane-1-carboxylate synthase